MSQIQKINYTRETNEKYPQFASIYEQYLHIAELMGIKNPPPFHIVNVPPKDMDSEAPVIAQIGPCPDDIVRVQLSTGATEAYQDKGATLMGVLAHELTHFINSDIATMVRVYRITFWTSLLAYIWLILNSGVLVAVADRSFYAMRNNTVEAEIAEYSLKIDKAAADVSRLEARGEHVGSVARGLAKIDKKKVTELLNLTFTPVKNFMWNCFAFWLWLYGVIFKFYYVMLPGVVLSYVLANAIYLSVSRPAEFRADETAAKVVGGETVKQMLEVIHYQTPWTNTFSNLMWDTHPTTTTRIERIDMLIEQGKIPS